MLGATIGDIVGSRFEFSNIKTKEFEFFHHRCEFTDDSVMTFAIARAIIESGEDYEKLGDIAVKYMREFGKLYPHCSKFP